MEEQEQSIEVRCCGNTALECESRHKIGRKEGSKRFGLWLTNLSPTSFRTSKSFRLGWRVNAARLIINHSERRAISCVTSVARVQSRLLRTCSCLHA